MEIGRKLAVTGRRVVHNDIKSEVRWCQYNKAGIVLQNVDPVQVTRSGRHLYYGLKVPYPLVEPVEAVYIKAYWRKAKILREKAITCGLKNRSSYCNSLLYKKIKSGCLCVLKEKNNQHRT